MTASRRRPVRPQRHLAPRSSFVQRSYRLVFKVPHYKSGAELAQMVEAARAKKP